MGAMITNPEAVGTAKADGTVTITFDHPPPGGYAWTGTLVVPNSTPNAKWTPLVDGIAQASWYGASQGGPYQVFQTQQLAISGTGLTPNVQYTAIFDAQQDLIKDAPSVSAAAMATTVATTRPALGLDVVQLASGQTVTKTYTLDINARALTLLAFRNSGPATSLVQLVLTGGTTGYVYASFFPGLNNTRPALNHVEINAAIDPTMQIQYIGVVGATFTVYLAEDFDPMVVGVESLPDTFNVIVELVQKSPTEQRVACGAGAATDLLVAGAAGYTRGFEVMVPYGSAVDANGVALKVALGTPASNTLGKELVPGGYYARSDFNGRVSGWNPSSSSNSIQVTSWF